MIPHLLLVTITAPGALDSGKWDLSAAMPFIILYILRGSASPLESSGRIPRHGIVREGKREKQWCKWLRIQYWLRPNWIADYDSNPLLLWHLRSTIPIPTTHVNVSVISSGRCKRVATICALCCDCYWQVNTVMIKSELDQQLRSKICGNITCHREWCYSREVRHQTTSFKWNALWSTADGWDMLNYQKQDISRI